MDMWLWYQFCYTGSVDGQRAGQITPLRILTLFISSCSMAVSRYAVSGSIDFNQTDRMTMLGKVEMKKHKETSVKTSELRVVEDSPSIGGDMNALVLMEMLPRWRVHRFLW